MVISDTVRDLKEVEAKIQHYKQVEENEAVELEERIKECTNVIKNFYEMTRNKFNFNSQQIS